MDTTTGLTPGLLEPAPRVGDAAATAILRTHYGLDASVRLLGSERDRTFLVTVPDAEALVLKVSNSADDEAVIAMENAAMRHIESVDPDLPIPRLLRTHDGASVIDVEADDGRRHQVRLMTAIPGATAEASVLPARFPSRLGAACARMARALRGFAHPAAYRPIEWDPRTVTKLRPFAAQLPDPARHAPVERLLDRFAGLPGSTAALPAFVLHGDVTMSNVMVDADGDLTGLIDFGDMHHTARVSDLAISLASLLRLTAAPWDAARRFLDGYQRVTPLEPEEVQWLGELVLARLVTTVLISAWRAPLHPDKQEYVTGWDAGSWRALDALEAMSPADLAGRFHRICGTARLAAVRRADPSLLPRRRAALGGTLAPLFYDEPLQVVAAEGAWIHTADGRRYLDAYNNVPVVGHAHPAVVQAISRQAAVLNVNSRYLHPNAVELAERLTATMPEGLDTCVFVNSGSEANDLAWRLATLFTGRTGAIVTDSAYHGVSEATAALSTNTYPPSARPPHVAVFPPPLPSADGRWPGRAAGTGAVRGAREALREAGHDVALLAVDTVFSSGGVLTPSDDYMRGLVEETHAAGGLFLADEVQAGFGRGGRNLWRYADFGIAPDLVTLGKPMGNGHPIAALVTRRAIAERLAAVDEFFSTFGGNPVSCAATLAVLDVIEESGLVERSGAVGDELRAGLTALTRDRGLGVRGQGLFAGVAIDPNVVPGLTAARMAERLRERGVLVGTTGPGGHVLKIRPPLVWEHEHVEVFLGAFASALG